MNKVYINCLSSFLPNESVDNEHIEDFLGYIEGKKSRIKSIVLKRNGIFYYSLYKRILMKKQVVNFTIKSFIVLMCLI